MNIAGIIPLAIGCLLGFLAIGCVILFGVAHAVEAREKRRADERWAMRNLRRARALAAEQAQVSQHDNPSGYVSVLFHLQGGPRDGETILELVPVDEVNRSRTWSVFNRRTISYDEYLSLPSHPSVLQWQRPLSPTRIEGDI